MSLAIDLRSYENLSLGGALTIKAECEILCSYFNFDKGYLLLPEGDIPEIILQILNTLPIFLELANHVPSKAFTWPEKNYNNKNIELHSFQRLEDLYKKYNLRPSLSWPTESDEQSDKNPLKDKINIFVHLKNTYPYELNESNTNWLEWKKFFDFSMREYPHIHYNLMGDDKIEDEVIKLDNIYVLKDEYSLLDQFYLIKFAQGFLGTASGICCAANFSSIPYIIFKHPYHHISEMKEELGERENFNFSCKNQFIIREEQTFKLLKNSLDIIMNEYEV